jgi:hypothetical protein
MLNRKFSGGRSVIGAGGVDRSTSGVDTGRTSNLADALYPRAWSEGEARPHSSRRVAGGGVSRYLTLRGALGSVSPPGRCMLRRDALAGIGWERDG